MSTEKNDLFLEIRRDRSGLRIGGVFIPFLLPGERPDAIMCVPWEQSKIPGAVIRACHTCGFAVSLAPSTQQVLQEHPDVPVYCLHCGYKELKKEEADAG